MASGAAISEEQTHILRLAHFLNEQGSLALKECIIYEIFNYYIQNNKIQLQNNLSQTQFDELFSRQPCPHFSKISIDVCIVISTTVFSLPSVPSGSDVLLRSHLEGEGLNTFLSGNAGQIRARKVLSKKQLGCLFPTVHFDKLDITLLSFLLFEIFYIKPTSPCFTKLPQQHHIQIGDDILRLRWYRNDVVHRGTTGISQEEFDSFWKDISGALIRIQGVECKSRLDGMRSMSIDGPMLSNYQQLIDQWHQDDLETRRYLEEIRQAVTDVGKSAGHRDYQNRIWWKAYLEEVMGKFLQNLKTPSDQKREPSEQLQNALLFENRADLLRACHILERNYIRFKTRSGSSLARSASSVESRSSHGKRSINTQKKETYKQKDCSSKEHPTTQASAVAKGKRRWTGPILYKSNAIQTTEDPDTPTGAELLCKVMQHTPTSSLDELSFHLAKNYQIHTPTSSLDVADLDAMDACSVFATVVDLHVPVPDIRRCGNGQPSRLRTQRTNNPNISTSSAAVCTDSTKTERGMYKREQKLERRKLRKMDKEDVERKAESVTQRTYQQERRISRPDTPVPFYQTHAPKTRETKPRTSHCSLESQDFHQRPQNKRWTTHPTRHDIKEHDSNNDRRKSAGDVPPGPFISIHKQIQDRNGGERLDFSEFTDNSLSPSNRLGFPLIDELDEDTDDIPREPPRQSQQSLKPAEACQKYTKPDMMSRTKGVISVLKGCVSKPSRT